MAYTTIDKPNDYFNTKLYTGNGTTQSITGVGFQPDFCWFKNRDTASGHGLFDVVRGTGERLFTNLNDAEYTDANTLTSFDSDGFSVGTESNLNGSGNDIVAWNWLAGGTPSSNTDGSITSNVSVNTTSGISIGTFTGTGANATVGHGLGSVPKYLWVKRRDGAGDWMVYHVSKGNTGAIFYNSTNSGATSSTYWQDTTPTTSVFSIGSNGNLNTSGESHSFVAFAEKKGFSKIGSYTGNGSSDGTFIFTGFKPAFVIVKQISGTNPWYMTDNKRDPFNVTSKLLLADSYGAELTGRDDFDFLSNGFKNRSGNTGGNASGNTYAYIAFAENPFVTSTGVPATAR